MKHLSLNGIDVINGLILSVYELHKEKLNPSNEEFIKLVHTYSNFVLGSCTGLKKNDLEICYKKLSPVLSKV